MAISQETIDRINFATDIADVVGDYVHLKRKGKDLIACCPFHEEKTPSFYVVPTKNIFYCFGCGKGGNAITFLMEHESMTYVEALKHLAAKYNIEIQEEQRTDEAQLQQAERESIYAVLNFANNFFKQQLKETDEGKQIAATYLKERGLNQEVIDTFQLGYSPEAREALGQAAVKAGYNEKYLEKAGLIIVKDDGKRLDRYRGRIIFPIQNIAGRVLGFAGRILTNDKNVAKYINSPETEVYHKSQVLYGLYQAKDAIKKADECYLTEGYLDVITLHQGGIKNVVASSGTSLTTEQIKLINRFTKNLTVLYDGDPAGIKASLRSIDLILQEGLNVRVVAFPDGHDPDSYLRQVGSADFAEYVTNHKQDFISFKAKVLYHESQNDPIKRADMIEQVMESIALIPDPVKRQLFTTEASKILAIDENTLIIKLNHILFSKARQQRNKNLNQREGSIYTADEITQESETVPMSEPEPEAHLGLQGQEQEFIRLLLRYATTDVGEQKKLSTFMLEELELIDFTHPVYSLMLDEFKSFHAHNQIPDALYFINHHHEEVRKAAAMLLTDRYKISPLWNEKHALNIPTESEILEELVHQNLLRLKWHFLNRKIDALLQALSVAQDAKETESLLTELMECKQLNMVLAKNLGIVAG